VEVEHNVKICKNNENMPNITKNIEKYAKNPIISLILLILLQILLPLILIDKN